MTRGVKVNISLDAILGMAGIPTYGIELCGVEMSTEVPDVFTVALCGTSEELPEVPEGGTYPNGYIEMTKTSGRIIAT